LHVALNPNYPIDKVKSILKKQFLKWWKKLVS
jgi:hypothetical protein